MHFCVYLNNKQSPNKSQKCLFETNAQDLNHTRNVTIFSLQLAFLYYTHGSKLGLLNFRIHFKNKEVNNKNELLKYAQNAKY